MKRIDVVTSPIDPAAYKGSFADARHVSREVSEPCAVYRQGESQPIAVYVELDERLPQALAALQRMRFTGGVRTGGMANNNTRVFGYQPKRVLRNQETCTAATLASEDPEGHATIANLSKLVEREYRRLNPDLYAQHEQIVSKVLPDWRLSGGLFTSGIINRNNKLPYHYDAGNFADCWSNMLVFKRACTGGDLVCPEIDLCFRLRDHSLLMFDGQSILHGVSPFRNTRRDGYRFTVVFYSLQQMWRCETKADTVKIAARRRTERERQRFTRMAQK